MNKFRHEIKYQCSELQLSVIKSRIGCMLKNDEHVVNGQYSIRSVYFDNYENKCFYENEAGTDPREKFRIRIYNADSSRITLECKRKERGMIRKTSCLLTKESYHKLMSGGSLGDLSDKPALLRKFIVLMKMELYKPTVIVEYDRTPFVYMIGNVRITLDRNIRFSMDFNHFFDKSISTQPIMPVGQHLLEVKYDELLPSFIKDTFQTGDLQQTTFSKYYLCRKISMGGQL